MWPSVSLLRCLFYQLWQNIKLNFHLFSFFTFFLISKYKIWNYTVVCKCLRPHHSQTFLVCFLKGEVIEVFWFIQPFWFLLDFLQVVPSETFWPWSQLDLTNNYVSFCSVWHEEELRGNHGCHGFFGRFEGIYKALKVASANLIKQWLWTSHSPTKLI